MIDAEWNAWQSSWAGATGPLPDIRARARKEVRLHRMAKVAFFLLMAVALAASTQTLIDRSSAVRAIGWIIVAFVVSMSIGYVAIQRGIDLRRTGNPRDAVAFLERRLRVEGLLAHLVRWVYAGLCVAFVVVFPRVIAGHAEARLEMAISYPWMFVVFVVTFTAPWWVARRNRRLQHEIDAWRHWMDAQRL